MITEILMRFTETINLSFSCKSMTVILKFCPNSVFLIENIHFWEKFHFREDPIFEKKSIFGKINFRWKTIFEKCSFSEKSNFEKKSNWDNPFLKKFTLQKNPFLMNFRNFDWWKKRDNPMWIRNNLKDSHVNKKHCELYL